MRIINFCAEGIRQAAEKGFFDWACDQDADFICVQDLREQEYELKEDVFFPSGYNAYFFDAVEKHSNGVAIYCRELPKAIITGLGFAEFDMQGLYLQADFERVSIASFMAPSAAIGDDAAQAKKMAFYEQFLAHLNKVRNKRREFIITGNWNIAHEPRDVQQHNEHADSSGFLPQERALLDQLYDELEYDDAFRIACSDADEFSWWPDADRAHNGWRVDTQVVSQGLRNGVEYGSIYKNQAFSNHAPVIMDYEQEL